MASERLEFEISGSAAQLQQALNDVFINGKKEARELAKELGQPVKKTVQIDVKTDSSGVARINVLEKERLGILDKIANAVSKVQKTEAGSLTSLRQQVNQAKQVRDGIAKYSETVDALGGKVKAINPLWAAQASRVAELSRALEVAGASTFWEKVKTGLRAQGFVSFINGLTQITQGFQSASIIIGQVTGSINNLIKTKADLQAFALSFKAINLSAAEATEALADVERIAVGLGTRINVVQDSFRQITPVILNSGGTMEDVSAIIEAMSSRFAAFDIAGDRSRRIMNGIIQAFAKGKLQAEELTQQISEAEPAFKTDFASALGVTVAELEKLVQQGKITVDVLIDTIPKLSKASLVYGKLGKSAIDAANALEKGNVTIDQVRDNIFNFNELNLRKLAVGLEPAIVAFIRLQATVTDAVTDILKFSALEVVSKTITGIVSAIQRSVGGFTALAKAALLVIEPIARVVSTLLSIPGAAEALGFAILGKAVISLQALKASFIASSAGATGFGRALAGATDFGKFFGGIKQLVTGNTDATRALARTSQTLNTLGSATTFTANKINFLKQQIVGVQNQLKKQQLGTGVAGPVTPQTAVLTSRLSELQTQLNQYTRTADRVASSTATATGRFTQLSIATSKSGGALGVLTGGARAAGAGLGLLAKGAGFVGAGFKALFVALGPIGIALAALAGLQAAYSNATRDSAGAIEESKQRIEGYQTLIKEIGGPVKAPNLSPLALAWDSFSLDFANTVDEIKENLNNLFNFTQKWSKDFVDALPGSIKILFGIEGSSGPFSEELEQNEVRLKRFARVAKVTIEGISAQAGEISSLTTELQKLRDSSDLSEKSQSELANRTKSGLSLIKASEDQYRKLREELDKYEKTIKKSFSPAQQAELDKYRKSLDEVYQTARQSLGPEITVEGAKQLEDLRKKLLSDFEEYKKSIEINLEVNIPPEQQKRLAALRQAVDEAGKEVSAASAPFKQFASDIGVTAEVINDQVFSISALNEKLKGLRERLESLDPGGVEFAKLSVEIAALTAGIELAQKKLQDPIELLVRIPASTEAAFAELNDLLAKQEAAQKKIQEQSSKDWFGEVDYSELERLQKEIAEVGKQIDNLFLLERKLLVQLQVQDQEFRATVAKLQGDATLTEIKLQTTIDQPKLREALTKVATFRNELQQLFQQQATIATRITDPTLGASERLALAREQAAVALQIKNTTAEATADLIDSAKQLRRELQGAQQDLLSIAARGREQGFALGGGQRSLELQLNAAKALDAELTRISRQRGLSFQFSGTSDEILQAKLNAVKFYQELETAEKRAEDLANGVNVVDKSLEKIAEANLTELFAGLATAVETLAGDSATAAQNSEGISSALTEGATQARAIADAITSLNGLSINVRLIGTPGLWTGGPTQAGQTYQVNELGQEGFMSAGGRITPIRKPKNALWRAPSSGTVIPAHIWSQMDVPKGGVQTTARPVATSPGNTLARVVRALQGTMTRGDSSSSAIYELSAVQARQSLEIGKLGRAINRLADKDQNIKVSVNGGGNMGYLQALNSRLG